MRPLKGEYKGNIRKSLATRVWNLLEDILMQPTSTTKIDLTVFDPISDDELLKILNSPPGSFSNTANAANVVRPWIAAWTKTGELPGGGEDTWNRSWPAEQTGDLYAAIVRFSLKYIHLWIVGNKVSAFVDPPDVDHQFEDYCDYLAFCIMTSDLRFRISECRDCGAYFIRTGRKGVRTLIPRCPGCYAIFRGKDSVEIGKRSRQAKRKEVYALIANEFAQEIGENPSWFKNPELIEEIVQAVKTQIKRKKLDHEPITTKWVLRGVNPDHRGAIARSARALLRRKGTAK